MKYTKSDMRWMAAGELGSYLGSLLLAITAYREVPLDAASLRVLAALVVFCVAAKVLHWFVHLGYKPGSEVQE